MRKPSARSASRPEPGCYYETSRSDSNANASSAQPRRSPLRKSPTWNIAIAMPCGLRMAGRPCCRCSKKASGSTCLASPALIPRKLKSIEGLKRHTVESLHDARLADEQCGLLVRLRALNSAHEPAKRAIQQIVEHGIAV